MMCVEFKSPAEVTVTSPVGMVPSCSIMYFASRLISSPPYFMIWAPTPPSNLSKGSAGLIMASDVS